MARLPSLILPIADGPNLTPPLLPSQTWPRSTTFRLAGALHTKSHPIAPDLPERIAPHPTMQCPAGPRRISVDPTQPDLPNCAKPPHLASILAGPLHADPRLTAPPRLPRLVMPCHAAAHLSDPNLTTRSRRLLNYTLHTDDFGDQRVDLFL